MNGSLQKENRGEHQQISKRLIDRIREPDPVAPAFGRHALRKAIRDAFAMSEQATDDAPILSEDKTADALIKRYSALAVSHKVTGILHSEEELQNQLEWYRIMVPWIVKHEFNKRKRDKKDKSWKNEKGVKA
jgi:hypothetical protein